MSEKEIKSPEIVISISEPITITEELNAGNLIIGFKNGHRIYVKLDAALKVTIKDIDTFPAIVIKW